MLVDDSRSRLRWPNMSSTSIDIHSALSFNVNIYSHVRHLTAFVTCSTPFVSSFSLHIFVGSKEQFRSPPVAP